MEFLIPLDVADNDSSATANAKEMGRFEGKLDMILDIMKSVQADAKTVGDKVVELATKANYVESHERRIQALEQSRSYALGWVAAAGMLGGLVGTVIMFVLNLVKRA